MQFVSDDALCSYVTAQLALARFPDGGTVFAQLRPQWRYADLPADVLTLSHLEWKLYRQADVTREGGDRVLAPGSMFGYWILRVTAGRRLFLFLHGNSSAGPGRLDKLLQHGSILAAEDVQERPGDTLADFINHVLAHHAENRYYLS